MGFEVIDLNNWNRAEQFEMYTKHTFQDICITANLDITEMLNIKKEKGIKFFPTYTYAVATIVNSHKEFKIGYNEKGELGYYDTIDPGYPLFNKESKTWRYMITPYNNDYQTFYENMVFDMEKYMDFSVEKEETFRKDIFNVTTVPWVSYSAMSNDMFDEGRNGWFTPKTCCGKYFKQGETVLLPATFQINHAGCDGYHVGLYFNDLQEMFKNAREWIK